MVVLPLVAVVMGFRLLDGSTVVGVVGGCFRRLEETGRDCSIRSKGSGNPSEGMWFGGRKFE